MRFYSFSLILCGLLPLAVACSTATTESPHSGTHDSDMPVILDGGPPATVDLGAHPDEGPHHGTLVELGNEEYHAEVHHDASTVTVHILDSAARKAVPIDATVVTINIVNNGQPEQFKLPASPESNEPEGKSSRFQLTDARLLQLIDAESAVARLAVTIAGLPYRGAIEHGHDQGGHDQGGHDQSGHDQGGHDHSGHDHSGHDH